MKIDEGSGCIKALSSGIKRSSSGFQPTGGDQPSGAIKTPSLSIKPPYYDNQPSNSSTNTPSSCIQRSYSDFKPPSLGIQTTGGTKAPYPNILPSGTIKPTSSVEYDAISYCFHCNMAYTHKVNAASFEYERDVHCPSCSQNLYTRGKCWTVP